MKFVGHLELKTNELARRATWLELFYDLVFVVVSAKLAHIISHPHNGHLSSHEYLSFAALFVPIL